MTKKDSRAISNVGFTIVELLVVIVVIGILAAITIVSYSGIAKKAIVSSLQSDLDNNSKQLKLYNVEHGYYPSLLDDNECPSMPIADTRYCLKASNGTSLLYSGGAQSFTLTATKNSVSYEITENSTPYNSTKISLSSIAPIAGTAQIGQTLTAGSVTPAAATVVYQWQSALTANGTYSDISGANSITYLLNPSNANKFIKVKVTGTGDYVGVQLSNETSSAVIADANWIVIGSQTWAKANLNVGTMISGTVAQANNSVLEKYCYGNNLANCTTYGGLYQWNEAMQYSTNEGAQGICPAGSHIPSDNDWKILEMQLGLTQAEADTANSFRGANQGTQLKTGGSSGLEILLAGNYVSPNFVNVSLYGYIWSSSESDTGAWKRNIYSSNAGVFRSVVAKTSGFSVRCVGD